MKKCRYKIEFLCLKKFNSVLENYFYSRIVSVLNRFTREKSTQVDLKNIFLS